MLLEMDLDDYLWLLYFLTAKRYAAINREQLLNAPRTKTIKMFSSSIIGCKADLWSKGNNHFHKI